MEVFVLIIILLDFGGEKGQDFLLCKLISVQLRLVFN
jgi:hypothetical protein